MREQDRVLSKNFTGIDSAYEAPVNPEITIDTTAMSVEDCVMGNHKLLGRK